MRRPARPIALLVPVLLLAGCSASTTVDAPSTVTVGTVTRTLLPSATITHTVPASGGSGLTKPGAANPSSSSAPSSPSGPSGPSGPSAPKNPSTSKPAPATAPAFPTAIPTAGSCPYLKSADVSPLAGQRVGKVELIAAAPQPICVFYRIVDGGWLGAVRVIDADTPAQAVAAVDAAVPPAESSPADRPNGWGGGYMLLPNGDRTFPESRAIYAVSKGTHAVIAWNSRDQTVKSRQLAEATIAALHW